MKYIFTFLQRWWIALSIGMLLSIFWLGINYYIHYEIVKDLPFREIVLKLLESFIEVLLFLLILKVMIGSNAVLNSIDIIFKKIYFQRDFLKTLKHRQLMEIAEDIHNADNTIVINDELQRRSAFKSIQAYWQNKKANNQNIKPYVILESNYIDTLYNDGQLIMHKKYLIKMMETDFFEMEYHYLPFDKIVNEDINEDKYSINQPGNRWSEKSFKHRMIGTYPAKLTLSNKLIKEKFWIMFHFKTQRRIQKNTEFSLEYSMTDKISLEDNDKNIKRRNDFFKTQFTGIPHGIRKITFQIESYNDAQNINSKLPFEPVLFIDGKDLNDEKKLYNETIYYKRWSWFIHKKDTNPKNIKFELHECN